MADLSMSGDASPQLSSALDRSAAARLRRRAERARQLLRFVHQEDLTEILAKLAAELEETAEDLELGATALRHPALLR
jgi:hypothetical protein